jgi:glucose 1-dehydrogenase
MSSGAPLAGQVALVTGGDRGIGAAISRELAARGACVMLNYHSECEHADRVVDEIRTSGSNAAAIQGDVSEENDAERMVSETAAKFGRIDILVANAGIQLDAPFLEMDVSQWRRVLEVNLTGQFLCAQAATRRFCAQGVPEHSNAAGKIVCMSSVHDIVPWAGHANYAAAKGGVETLMRTLGQELARHNIRVVGVAPGAIRTDINRDVWEDEERASKLCELIPYGRIGNPGDVAMPVAWLVSDEADYITGTTLYIDGGMTLYPGFIRNG